MTGGTIGEAAAKIQGRRGAWKDRRDAPCLWYAKKRTREDVMAGLNWARVAATVRDELAGWLEALAAPLSPPPPLRPIPIRVRDGDRRR